MKVILTDGTGFAGSQVLRQLAADPAVTKVTCLMPISLTMRTRERAARFTSRAARLPSTDLWPGGGDLGPMARRGSVRSNADMLLSDEAPLDVSLSAAQARCGLSPGAANRRNAGC